MLRSSRSDLDQCFKQQVSCKRGGRQEAENEVGGAGGENEVGGAGGVIEVGGTGGVIEVGGAGGGE